MEGLLSTGPTPSSFLSAMGIKFLLFLQGRMRVAREFQLTAVGNKTEFVLCYSGLRGS